MKDRKKEKKGGGGNLIKIEERPVEERDQDEGKRRCWGTILTKLYCYMMSLYE